MDPTAGKATGGLNRANKKSMGPLHMACEQGHTVSPQSSFLLRSECYKGTVLPLSGLFEVLNFSLNFRDHFSLVHQLVKPQHQLVKS